MRVIVNVVSDRIAGATGWRVREVAVRGGATLEVVFRSADVGGGKGTLYEVVTDSGGFRKDLSLFVGGEFMQGEVSLERAIRDSEQIQLWDWPFSVRDS